jgi:putative zinc finger/helix-turn-helix YgiT family protein
MLCIQCRKAQLLQKQAEVQGEVHGESYLVECEALVCSKCGYTTVGAGQIQEFMRALADAYRERHGMLTSKEIKRLRKALNWSQIDLASKTGAGVASIKRWELGKIQDAAMDKLLRLSLDPEFARKHASELEQTERRGLESKTIQFSASEDRNQTYKPFAPMYLENFAPDC